MDVFTKNPFRMIKLFTEDKEVKENPNISKKKFNLYRCLTNKAKNSSKEKGKRTVKIIKKSHFFIDEGGGKEKSNENGVNIRLRKSLNFGIPPKKMKFFSLNFKDSNYKSLRNNIDKIGSKILTTNYQIGEDDKENEEKEEEDDNDNLNSMSNRENNKNAFSFCDINKENIKNLNDNNNNKQNNNNKENKNRIEKEEDIKKINNLIGNNKQNNVNKKEKEKIIEGENYNQNKKESIQRKYSLRLIPSKNIKLSPEFNKVIKKKIDNNYHFYRKSGTYSNLNNCKINYDNILKKKINNFPLIDSKNTRNNNNNLYNNNTKQIKIPPSFSFADLLGLSVKNVKTKRTINIKSIMKKNSKKGDSISSNIDKNEKNMNNYYEKKDTNNNLNNPASDNYTSPGINASKSATEKILDKKSIFS